MFSEAQEHSGLNRSLMFARGAMQLVLVGRALADQRKAKCSDSN